MLVENRDFFISPAFDDPALGVRGLYLVREKLEWCVVVTGR